MDDFFKLPRIYTDAPLSAGAPVALSAAQAHYFHTVLRRGDGDKVRLFNGRDGEWLGSLTGLGKKAGTLRLESQLKPQPPRQRRLHLLFAPIKKHRMDWLVEKAVELGATDLHPVLTRNTEVRKINEDRLTQQIFEAAEQSEHLSIPALHPLKDLTAVLKDWGAGVPVLACIERFDAKPIAPMQGDVAVLIGPEGGFTAEEKETIAASPAVRPVSLGEAVLRCETAALKALSVLT